MKINCAKEMQKNINKLNEIIKEKKESININQFNKIS